MPLLTEIEIIANLSEVLKNINQNPVWSTLVPTVSTLIAAFGGAWFAFKLHDLHKTKQDLEAKLSIFYSVQFKLWQQLTQLMRYNEQYLELDNKSDLRWFGIRSTLSFNHLTSQTNTSSLLFLGNDNIKLIAKIIEAENLFTTTVQLIDTRSKVHRERLQPRLEEVGFLTKSMSYEEVLKCLGRPLVLELKTMTDEVILLVNHTIRFYKSILEELTAAGHKLFPSHEILDNLPVTVHRDFSNS